MKNATYLQYFSLIFQEENHNILLLLRISLDSNPINSGIPYLLGFVILSDGLTVTYKISSGLRPLMSGKLINYDATMYASTMYLVLIKISSFLCVFLPYNLFTLVNYVKVVQWPRYTEARILYSYALKKKNDITWSNVFMQNWTSISLLMSYKEKHLQM